MVCVVKVLKNQSQSADELDFQNEISVMSTLRHPNLVLFLGAVLAQEPKMLISEFLDGGRHTFLKVIVQ
jgi:serine/threonine protein kinase